MQIKRKSKRPINQKRTLLLLLQLRLLLVQILPVGTLIIMDVEDVPQNALKDVLIVVLDSAEKIVVKMDVRLDVIILVPGLVKVGLMILIIQHYTKG